eukprot:919956-Alexandrium_andersonii.AAC.1
MSGAHEQRSCGAHERSSCGARMDRARVELMWGPKRSRAHMLLAKKPCGALEHSSCPRVELSGFSDGTRVELVRSSEKSSWDFTQSSRAELMWSPREELLWS